MSKAYERCYPLKQQIDFRQLEVDVANLWSSLYQNIKHKSRIKND